MTNPYLAAEATGAVYTINKGGPSITTKPASAISSSGTTLNGTVNAKGCTTTVTFEYGLDTSYGTTITADQSPVTGTTDTAVSVNISGLAPNTTYHYRVVGQNTGGTKNGAEMTFTTASALQVSSTNIIASYITGPTSFTITFNKDVSTIGGSTGADSATNPANYLLLEEAAQTSFQTTACDNTDLVNDTKIIVNSAGYDNSTFTSTINFNGGMALPQSSYRLFVCGTTAIEDIGGNILAGGGTNPGTDYTFDFVV